MSKKLVWSRCIYHLGRYLQLWRSYQDIETVTEPEERTVTEQLKKVNHQRKVNYSQSLSQRGWSKRNPQERKELMESLQGDWNTSSLQSMSWPKLSVLVARMMSKTWTQLYSASSVGYGNIFHVRENLISLQKNYMLYYVSHNVMPYGQCVQYVVAKVL